MTVQPLTLSEILAASRTTALRNGIVATLKARLPFVEVQPHPGKLDVADVVERRHVRAPGLMVGVVRQAPRSPDLGGHDCATREVAVYVVAEDHVTAAPARRIDRDELGHALADAVIGIATDDDLARWGLSDIGHPREVEAKPLFTAMSHDKGTAFYVVTWSQDLPDLGRAPLPIGPAPEIDPHLLFTHLGETPDPLGEIAP